VRAARVVYPRADEPVRVVDADAVGAVEGTIESRRQEAQDGAGPGAAVDGLDVPARVEHRVPPRLSGGRRPARRGAHAKAVERELGEAPLVLGREADRQVGEEPEPERPRRGREAATLDVRDELREAEERDRVSVRGAERAAACSVSPRGAVPEALIAGFPAPDVARRIRRGQRLEQLVT